MQVKTKIIKRNGEEVDFQKEKIVNAIKAANAETENIHQMNDYQIIAVTHIFLRHFIPTHLHDAGLNHILNVFHVHGMC